MHSGPWLPVCLLVLSAYMVTAQIPAFGGCPKYDAMPMFNKTRFLGTWFEAERYFTVTELASKCIAVTYETRPDGKIWVNNAITNRFTNVQRIISGVLESTGKAGEGRYNIKYSTFPINYDASLVVLDTDYDSFAVIWSCSRIGPFGNTQSAWMMTRERFAPGPVIQRAYGVLDKYKISRTYFIKTNQENCDTLPPAPEAVNEDVVTTEETGVTEADDYDENDLGPDVIEVKKPSPVKETVPAKVKPATVKPAADKNKQKPTAKP